MSPQDSDKSPDDMPDENDHDEPRGVEDAVVEHDPSDAEPSEDAMFEDVEVAADAGSPGRRPSRLALLLALLALTLSLAALSGVGYLVFFAEGDGAADDTADAYLAGLSESIRLNEAALADLERRIAALPATDVAAVIDAADLDALERSLDARLRALEAVAVRVASLESSMSALRGISTGARDAWLLGEAEYYLQIANAQLRLAGNPQVATLALRLADERLVELGDPGLTDVRRALTDELAELDALENPDIEGATLTLASLSRVVDSLPIRRQIMTGDPQTDAPDSELSGTDRALASLKGALSNVVSVRRTDEAARPLIAPDAVYFLRANLSLQLQAARLAMLRGEQALFEQSLDDASAWLREYYDTESQPVRSVLQTIGEIRDDSFTRALPDISTSLRLLRQYMAFLDASRNDAKDARPDTESEPAQ